MHFAYIRKFRIILVTFIMTFYGPGNISNVTVPKLLKYFIFNERPRFVEFTVDFSSIVQRTLNLCLKQWDDFPCSYVFLS
jgi:hypothetical protein